MTTSDSHRPPPRFFGGERVLLPTGSQSAAFDRWAIDEVGVPAPVLMENAGRSAALVLHRIHPRGRVMVAVGKGNNGGDGLVLARTLRALGREIRVALVGGRPPDDPLLHGWSLEADPLPESADEARAALGWGDILVDALLGTGVDGEPRGHVRTAIEATGALAAPIVALDVPSGTNADDGSVPGAAVIAHVTVTFGAPKLGALRFPARTHAGRVIAVEIGFPPAPEGHADARLITPGWASAHRPRREAVSHKKAEGRLLVLAGSPGVAGAAVLAARGALRAGAGYVRVASHPEHREALAAAAPEALFVDVTNADGLMAAATDADALAAGPGMGTDAAAAERLNRLLADGGMEAVLLDADALTLLGRGALPAVGDAATPERRLLTPHPGEMARLGAEPDAISREPLAVCRAASERLGSTVLLKGRPSWVAAPGRPMVWMSGSGSSDLARAGVGDVLTGVAGAYLARGCDGETAAGLALHYTGRAAALRGFGDALLPTDIAEGLADALQEPASGVSDLDLPFVTLDLDPLP